MSFSKTLMFLFLIPALAAAEDQAIDDILRNSKSIINEADELAGQEADELKEIEPAMEEDSSWLQGVQLNSSSTDSDNTDTAQQRGWNAIMGEVEQSAPTMDQGPPRPAVPGDVMYVYISLSMPEETIRGLFLQALADKELRTIIFLLRGWDAPGPNQLVSRLNALFPDAEKLRELPNVQINPVLFQQQMVDAVPTFSTKDKGGRWGRVIGSTSIQDAVSRIEANRYDGEIIGPTFEIEEPDILKLIQKRIANVDWESQVERVKKDVLTRPTVGRALPYATIDETYLVDLTIINNKDLRGATGEVFAPAGVSVNPFDYMTTQKRYVFFDANSEEQVDQALEWRRMYPYTTMISTIPVSTVEGRKRVIELLEQPVHEINDLLISRFRLKAVPSIAYQDGNMLRVDIAATAPKIAAANAQGSSNE